MNWQSVITKWIKKRGAPEDAEFILCLPGSNPITGEDDRLWIDVLSESYGLENTTDMYGPESDYDPVFAQYMLIEVDLFYRAQYALEGLLDGLDANFDGRDGISSESWEERIEKAREVFGRLESYK